MVVEEGLGGFAIELSLLLFLGTNSDDYVLCNQNLMSCRVRLLQIDM